MTGAELAALPGNTVGTKIAAEVLGVSRWGLTVSAKEGKLTLPHVWSGNRLFVSKAALLDFVGYHPQEKEE